MKKETSCLLFHLQCEGPGRWFLLCTPLWCAIPICDLWIPFLYLVGKCSFFSFFFSASCLCSNLVGPRRDGRLFEQMLSLKPSVEGTLEHNCHTGRHRTQLGPGHSYLKPSVCITSSTSNRSEVCTTVTGRREDSFVPQSRRLWHFLCRHFGFPSALKSGATASLVKFGRVFGEILGFYIYIYIY